MTRAREVALISGNELTEGVVRCSEWLGVIWLSFDECRMCGKLHHTYMMHIFDEAGRVIAIGPMEYEAMKQPEWEWDG